MELTMFLVGALVGAVIGAMTYRRLLKRDPALLDEIADKLRR